jgi:hypothetical protein
MRISLRAAARGNGAEGGAAPGAGFPTSWSREPGRARLRTWVLDGAAAAGVTLLAVVGTAGRAAADVTAPSPVEPPGTEGLTMLLSWAMWLVTFAGVIGVLIAGGSMMVAQRQGHGAEQASKLGWVLAGCCAAAAAAPIVNVLL